MIDDGYGAEVCRLVANTCRKRCSARLPRYVRHGMILRIASPSHAIVVALDGYVSLFGRDFCGGIRSDVERNACCVSRLFGRENTRLSAQLLLRVVSLLCCPVLDVSFVFVRNWARVGAVFGPVNMFYINSAV